MTRKILVTTMALVVVLLPSVGEGHSGCDQVGQNFFGDEHANSCIGNDYGNFMYGYAGADFLSGRDLADEINGGSGPDLLWGGGGNDSLYGQEGDDDLSGHTQTDYLDDELGDSAGDIDRICDGQGQDHIHLNDGDGNDTWFRLADGVSELTVDLSPGDNIVDVSSCPI